MAKIESLTAEKAALEPLNEQYQSLCDAHNEAFKPLAQMRGQLLQPIMDRGNLDEVDQAHEKFEGDLAGALQFAKELGLSPERSDEFTAARRKCDECGQRASEFESQHSDALNRYWKIEVDLKQAQKELIELRAATAGVVTFHQSR
jgi:hypothetical protein